MNITINNRECSAQVGDRLLDVARAGHSHIGYFCGGNAICQTCYVRVLEGHDLLSPISDAEKSMLSDTLIKEGTRMACQTLIEKPGTIRILTEVEAAKKMTLENPLQLPTYMGKMGWESAIKFTDTIAFQARREQGEYALEPSQLLRDVAGAIGDAINLVFEAVQAVFGVKRPAEKAEPKVGNGHCCDASLLAKLLACDNGHSRVVSPEVLQHQQESCVTCN
ncbi:MAG: (2Fe-2S)-binding protein [Chlorobaculum sp.]|jgi:chlorosome envelope protein X|nr:(2Fe-2S)-binding protein [Chlorobaculum sp.]